MVVLVPDMPSTYTFVINSLGFIVTMSASVLLLAFLSTRSISQKNLLNRILALITIIMVLGSLRHYLMSFIACFWNFELKELVGSYPALSAGLLSARPCILMLSVALCALSTGRLLLVTNPVAFHKINLTIMWAVVTGLLAAVLTGLYYAYGVTVCHGTQTSGMLETLKTELGIPKKFEDNATANTKNPLEEDKAGCRLIPLLPLMMTLFILLEMAEPIYVLVKEFIKLKKENVVTPTKIIQIDNQPSRSL